MTKPGGAETAAALGLAIAAAVLLCFRATYEADVWWHLAQGREVAAGRLVTTNLFSFTYPEHPQAYTTWLYDLATFLLWRAGGVTAIQASMAATLAAALFCSYRASRVRTAAAASLAVVALGLFVIQPRMIPRPHVVSFAGIAACAWLVERARRSGSARPLFAAVPVVAVWSNFHVECVFGAALVAGFAFGEWVRPASLTRAEAYRAIAAAGACFVAPLVNPYGHGLYAYLLDNVGVPSVIRIAELQPPYLAGYAPFFAFLVLGLALLAHDAKRVAVSEAIVVAAFAILALRNLRFTALFFAVAPIFAARLGNVVAERRPWVPLAALWAGLLLARISPTGLVARLEVGERALVVPGFFSTQAVEFVRASGLRGPVFNSMNLGGFLEWMLYPDVRTFHDSRLQAYPQEHFRQVMAAYRSQSRWDALVARVDWAVLSVARPNELSGAGRFPRAAWATVFWDEGIEILVRRAGAFGALAEEKEYRELLPGFDPFPPLGKPRDPERLLAEARRNALENHFGFSAVALLCLADDEAACRAASELAGARPEIQRAYRRLVGIRKSADP